MCRQQSLSRREGRQAGKHGGSAHFAFNHDDSNQQSDRADFSDPGSGINFQAAQVSSATFDEVAHSVTLTGLGTDNGLPVAFTIVAVTVPWFRQGCSASRSATVTATAAICSTGALQFISWNSVERMAGRPTAGLPTDQGPVRGRARPEPTARHRGRTCLATRSRWLVRSELSPRLLTLLTREFSDLVTRADAAPYSAKRKGRNRVEFALE
jgi:hypothetical protein